MPSPAEDARIAEARPVARAIRDDIATIRFDEARTLDDLIGPDWLETLALRAAQAAIEALRRPDDGRSDREGGEPPHSRVLRLGDDGQSDTPRRPEFWRARAEFGVTEEWACWVMECGINPLSDLSLAGLRGLVKEHGTMTAQRARDGADLSTGSALEAPPTPVPQQQTEGTGDAWPSRCIKPNACARHRQCVYAQSTEACPYFGRDLTADVAAAEATRPDPARPGGRDA